MTKHTQELIRIVRDEIPSLRYDFQNGSTHYSLQAPCIKLLTIVEYLLHDAILDAVSPEQPTAAPAPAPIPVPVPVARPAFARPAAIDLPPLGNIAQSVAQSVAPVEQIPGMADMPIQAGVANVFVTTQGTKVVGPTGQTAALPPGAAVSLADVTGVPELPPAPDGGVNVILPPGGGMSPDVAALLTRTGS
jgi:hypothetical protein